MRQTEIIIKIEKVVDVIMGTLNNDDNRLFICAISSAQFLNYYIEKGMIPISEKEIYIKFILDYLEAKHLTHFSIPDFVRNRLIQIMNDQKGYEYEKLISPIFKQINYK